MRFLDNNEVWWQWRMAWLEFLHQEYALPC
jgi:hypothetical protein